MHINVANSYQQIQELDGTVVCMHVMYVCVCTVEAGLEIDCFGHICDQNFINATYAIYEVKAVYLSACCSKQSPQCLPHLQANLVMKCVD